MDQGKPKRTLKPFVAYIYVVVKVEGKGDEEKMFAAHAINEVRSALAKIDNEVHIAKVGVMTAEEDEEQKQNIAEGVAPWLKGGKA